MISLSPSITSSSTCYYIIDALLFGINLFNIFVLFTYLQPVESPLKTPLINLKYRIVSKVHSTPLVVSTTLSALLCITTTSFIKYTCDVSSSNEMLIRAIISGYTFVVTCIFVKLSNIMITLSVDRVLDVEKEVSRHDIVSFRPPSKSVMKALMAPYKPFFAVETTGLERIPDNTPHFYVSNHSLYGIEMPVVLNELYQKKGIFLRGLADHFHFATPNGPIIKRFGAVDGTRDNVDVLMEVGQDILVYPSGGHEVLKHGSVPRYELMWKQRLGFARLAIKHGYPIIPTACVGTEDMFDTIGNIPTGFKGMVVPISVTTPCRIQKIYMWFGNPIPTTQYNREYSNDDYAKEVRDLTKAAVERGIRELQAKQSVDPERYMVDQYAAKIRNCVDTSLSVSSSSPTYNSKEEEKAAHEVRNDVAEKRQKQA